MEMYSEIFFKTLRISVAGYKNHSSYLIRPFVWSLCDFCRMILMHGGMREMEKEREDGFLPKAPGFRVTVCRTHVCIMHKEQCGLLPALQQGESNVLAALTQITFSCQLNSDIRRVHHILYCASTFNSAGMLNIC